jgi:hypothetical protein
LPFALRRRKVETKGHVFASNTLFHPTVFSPYRLVMTEFDINPCKEFLLILSRRLAMGLSSSLALFGAQAAFADSMPLLAHRAIYDLTLVKSDDTKGPSAAVGLIAYDFSGSACEGYATKFRQVVKLDPQEGESRVTDMRSATFEDADSKSFQYTIDTAIDNHHADGVDGSLSRAKDGTIALKLKHPKIDKASLSAAILFPTEHILHILAAAKAGDTTVSAQVFDGSDDGEKVYDTLTVIGHKTTSPPPEKAVQIDALKDVPRWPVTISYFDQDKSVDTPAYTTSFDLYENGVSRGLRVDYGSFVLAGEITKFEVISQKACK